MFWAAILMVRRLSDEKVRKLSGLVSSLYIVHLTLKRAMFEFRIATVRVHDHIISCAWYQHETLHHVHCRRVATRGTASWRESTPLLYVLY